MRGRWDRCCGALPVPQRAEGFARRRSGESPPHRSRLACILCALRSFGTRPTPPPRARPLALPCPSSSPFVSAVHSFPSLYCLTRNSGQRSNFAYTVSITIKHSSFTSSSVMHNCDIFVYMLK